MKSNKKSNSPALPCEFLDDRLSGEFWPHCSQLFSEVHSAHDLEKQIRWVHPGHTAELCWAPTNVSDENQGATKAWLIVLFGGCC